MSCNALWFSRRNSFRRLHSLRGSSGCGPYVKSITHRCERRGGRSLCYKAKVSIHE